MIINVIQSRTMAKIGIGLLFLLLILVLGCDKPEKASAQEIAANTETPAEPSKDEKRRAALDEIAKELTTEQAFSAGDLVSAYHASESNFKNEIRNVMTIMDDVNYPLFVYGKVTGVSNEGYVVLDGKSPISSVYLRVKTNDPRIDLINFNVNALFGCYDSSRFKDGNIIFVRCVIVKRL